MCCGVWFVLSFFQVQGNGKQPKKQNKKNEKQGNESDGDDQRYLRWNLETELVSAPMQKTK